MTANPEKLRELAYSLSDDQRRLLREGLALGDGADAEALIASIQSVENQDKFRRLVAEAPDGGAPDAGVPDAGTPDSGTGHPPTVEPPLTRW